MVESRTLTVPLGTIQRPVTFLSVSATEVSVALYLLAAELMVRPFSRGGGKRFLKICSVWHGLGGEKILQVFNTCSTRWPCSRTPRKLKEPERPTRATARIPRFHVVSERIGHMSKKGQWKKRNIFQNWFYLHHPLWVSCLQIPGRSVIWVVHWTRDKLVLVV